MDNTKVELGSIELAIDKAHEEQRRELSELELALIGGGNGDTILA